MARHITTCPTSALTDYCTTGRLSRSAKTAKGSVRLSEIHLFKPLVTMRTNYIAKWAFAYLKDRGVTDNWGVSTYGQLKEQGKEQTPPGSTLPSEPPRSKRKTSEPPPPDSTFEDGRRPRRHSIAAVPVRRSVTVDTTREPYTGRD